MAVLDNVVRKNEKYDLHCDNSVAMVKLAARTQFKLSLSIFLGRDVCCICMNKTHCYTCLGKRLTREMHYCLYFNNTTGELSMKKQLLAIALLATPLYAVADTGPGCGWGAMLFEGKDGLGPNVLAATTNGSTGNQTFGMTTGTAGCDPSKPVTTSAADDFLNSNMDKLAKDMAIGHGESLHTLAGLLGIDEKDQSEFYRVTKDNFTNIFDSAHTNSRDVLISLRMVMKQNARLSKYIS